MKTRISQILFTAFIALLLVAGNVEAKGTELKLASSLENDYESALVLENWMLEDNFFQAPTGTLTIQEECEAELTIEDWMINELEWGTKTVEISEESDKDLTIEGWMTNAKSWDFR